MKEFLIALESKYRADLASDPLEIPHRYRDPKDREIAAFICSMFAYGNVKAMKTFLNQLLDRMGESPFKALQTNIDVKGLYYRFQTARDVKSFLTALGKLSAGTHEPVLESYFGTEEQTTGDRITSFQKAFLASAEKQSRGLRHLIGLSDKSARKRYAMFLRWMVRTKHPDLGLYKTFRARDLVMPVDVHISKMSRNLGWTSRKSADWKTAVEITDHLKTILPEDPLRFDFALTRPGMLGHCKSRYVPNLCETCVLKGACLTFARGVSKNSRRS